MLDPSPGENLLFAILAFKAAVIDGAHLNAALKTWGKDQTRPMARILRDLNALDDDGQSAVALLVKMHLKKHGNDAAASLRGLPPLGAPGIELPPLRDHALNASLRHLLPPAALPSLPPARTVESAPTLRFNKLEEHAQGGLGIVFLAEDTELHRQVALKEIRADAHPDDPDTRARFLREGEITGRLEHPGIVPVYSLSEYATGRPFYAMRFIRGENLTQAIRRFHAQGADRGPGQQTLELRRLLERFLDACNAVAYAHSRGVLHRDLKPDNIMLGPFGETLVVDWGLAKVLGVEEAALPEGALAPCEGSDYSPTQRGAVFGTPRFMSPEQAVGKLELSPASDVYALGAILYEMLTGRPAFAGDTAVVLARVGQGDFLPPRRVNAAVPETLEAICLKAMARQPGDRHASAEDLVQAIENWLLGREQAKARALAQVEALRDASPPAVPGLLKELRPCREDVEPRLRTLWVQPELRDSQRLRIGLALLPFDAAAVRDRLAGYLLEAEDPQEVVLIRNELQPFSAAMRDELWGRVGDRAVDPGQRFRVLVALAAFDPDNPAWPQAAGHVVEQLLAANPLHVGIWKQALEPIRLHLLDSLGAAFRDGRGTGRGRLAATILADYAHDRPEVLAGLACTSDESQHAVLLPRLREQPEKIAAALLAELERSAPPEGSDVEYDALALRQATAAVTLLHLGHEEAVWPLLRHSEDPSRRSYLLHHLAPYGVGEKLLLRRLVEESEVSARRAVLLALGEYPTDSFPPAVREAVMRRLLAAYRDDPDPGIHGGAEWALHRWGHEETLRQALEGLRGQAAQDRRWYVNDHGQTFTLIPGPVEFLMGSPETEPDRVPDETRHRKRIPRSFALSSRPVTVAQFQDFLEAHPEVRHNYTKWYSPDDDGPIIAVSWFQAVQYCNWLSKEEGMAQEQWCYPEIDQIGEGMSMPAGYLERTGYRLPSEAEWEYACRAGAATSRFFGRSDRLLGKYAWFQKTSNDRAWPSGLLKPNDLGLFDMLGNVWEWCQESAWKYKPGPAGKPAADEEDKRGITDKINHALRGGSFANRPPLVRCAPRNFNRPSSRNSNFGLRVARTCH